MAEKPTILKRLTQQIKENSPGVKDPEAAAIAALRRYGSMEKDSIKLTEGGKIRNEMSPGDRAKDRASKRSGHPTSAYNYDPKTNAATLKTKFPKKI
jgi:hypothetical protein